MAVGQPPKTCPDMKRKIAELERVRSHMRLEIMRLQREPVNGSEEEIAYTENSLVLLEEELRDLLERYEGECHP